jgi:hypothetical protein
VGKNAKSGVRDGVSEVSHLTLCPRYEKCSIPSVPSIEARSEVRKGRMRVLVRERAEA